MRGRALWLTIGALLLIVMGGTLGVRRITTAGAPSRAGAKPASGQRSPSLVSIEAGPGGGYSYLVDGQRQIFIGIGYNPIYRDLAPAQRASAYRRDFALMQAAGANTILGWDKDKGYVQDTFDDVTLDTANEYGIGVVMPLSLPPAGAYGNPQFVASLLSEARTKVSRFKDYPALRMWGVGNEVFWGRPPSGDAAFEAAYLKIADLVHRLDPNHPVIYRGAEDRWVPEFAQMLRSRPPRPWLLYGMNVFNKNLTPFFQRWPSYHLSRPLAVTEFNALGSTGPDRARRAVAMWRQIRASRQFVIGGAVYAWTTAGPEPTDTMWGLMDAGSHAVDGTFAALGQAWHTDQPGSAPQLT